MQLYFYTIITANIHQNFELPRKFIEINYREKLARQITEKKTPKNIHNQANNSVPKNFSSKIDNTLTFSTKIGASDVCMSV